MTKLQKIENIMNKLLKRLAKEDILLDQEDIDILNLNGFLYSVGRRNALQMVSLLTKVALKTKLTMNEILELLEGNL